MSDYRYAGEKLRGAVSTLAGDGGQKGRLADAIIGNLAHLKPEEQIPSELRRDFVAFMKQMTSAAAKGDEGTIQATIATMDEWAVTQAIDRIISFYGAVCSYEQHD